MGSLLKGVGKAVKKIARPKVLLPLAALAIGGPMAAKAIAASAVLIGKASQSNQQLNQALADLKGDGGGTTSATFAEYGMNEVVDGATPIIAGEAGAELVQITPLEGPNTQGPQGQGQIIITGNVMSKDFVEDELVEQLKESIRQGYDFR